MRIDFHSHILPEMDDGASSVGESVEMLKILADAGVECVVLTPHFYRQNESIEKFLDRRGKAYEKLCAATQGISGIPKLVLGAEVYFYPSLSSDPDFEKLCIENTDFMLLELPFEHFYDNFYSDFAKFMNRCDVKIVLAHIERYLTFGNTVKDINRLLETGSFICQMNCKPLTEVGVFKNRHLISMISDGTISVIGTDAHNLSSRPPMYKKAEEVIRKKCGEKSFERICRISEEILFGE